ncbi:copper resistance protein B [Sphingobium amiense]|uniref:Copper resistance protein B n=1 Tax=Sphingobium amiense TaxID=135719 RepID=A0A494W9Z1_9SPHN|nr:copper resistance protein B [Sphingobium amiense]BBD97222.1 copper resistance protein B [Sphingobium amiense]
MRKFILLSALFASAPVSAQQAMTDSSPHADHAMSMPMTEGDAQCPPEHAAMGHCTPQAEAVTPPHAGPSAAALSGPEYAADAVWGAGAMEPARRSVYAEHGFMNTGKILIDRLEYAAQKGRDGYSWEGDAWYGGDYNRLWTKFRGEGAAGKAIESAEVQALWSRALDPWFNIQAGVRYDIRPKPDRAHLAVGIEGLAPYLFDVNAALFLSDRGDLTARVEAEYDQRITNRLILQPSVEVNLAAQDVRSVDVGAGLSSVEAGLRLRYEFVPEFAPYFGFEYEGLVGRTARLARAGGEDANRAKFVIGIRTWF